MATLMACADLRLVSETLEDAATRFVLVMGSGADPNIASQSGLNSKYVLVECSRSSWWWLCHTISSLLEPYLINCEVATEPDMITTTKSQKERRSSCVAS